jgi:hypothetical protein
MVRQHQTRNLELLRCAIAHRSSMLRIARNDGYCIVSPLVRRDIPNSLRMRRDILKAVFEMHALVGRRMPGDRYARPPFLGGADWPRGKPAAAVRADIIEFFGRAGSTEGAFVAANERFC